VSPDLVVKHNTIIYPANGWYNASMPGRPYGGADPGRPYGRLVTRSITGLYSDSMRGADLGCARQTVDSACGGHQAEPVECGGCVGMRMGMFWRKMPSAPPSDTGVRRSGMVAVAGCLSG
jgi:hypothetical protein